MVAYYLELAARVLVFGGFVLAAVVASAHWLVATRKITPFHAYARFGRQLGAPFVKPLEQRLLRSGGNPGSAPYFLSWAALLGGLAFLALVQWLIGFVYTTLFAASAGPGSLIVFAVSLTFQALQAAIFIRVIASWFAVSPYSRPMRIIHGMTDWLLEPLRRIIPPLGMIDVSPIVAYFMLMLAQGFVVPALQRALGG